MLYLKNLKELGLRVGDWLEIDPLYGKKKKIQLMRTEITLESEGEVKKKDCSLFFPTYGSEAFQLRLKLDPFPDKRGKGGRFLLESLNETPFCLNGQWTFKSYLKRGDWVEFGGNRLNFLKEFKLHNDFSIPSKVIQSNMNILIEGETGTGKTYLAKKIHEKSFVKGKFIHLNLASFSENLLESELFGHVKGSYTGAISDKKGAFEEAEEGTLFLDEIDSLSLEMQTKLLLFLDNQRYRRVGELREKVLKTRLIFAAGCSLETMVGKKLFRKDFFFRVSSGFHIRLPALRSDHVYCRNVLLEYSKRYSVFLEESLIKFYQGLTWPGNLRQLFAHLDRKRVLSGTPHFKYDSEDEKLLQSKIPYELLQTTPLQLSEFNYMYVNSVFQRYGLDKDKTCEVLKVSKYLLNKVLEGKEIQPTSLQGYQ